MSHNVKVTIIGAGLVGSLCACYMAKRGYTVSVYEQREDIRNATAEQGKSINLALSNRGRKALRFVGLEDEVLKNAIPMKGRFLHNTSGKTKFVPYDINNQCLYSVGRNVLNEILLTAAAKSPKINLHFRHKLLNADFANGTATFKNLETGEVFAGTSDFIIGADGAHSTLRTLMQRSFLFCFSQTYIEHGYVELTIDAEKGKQMAPNCLHIWPRGSFMMIALPNCEGSWTVTLFMPYDRFATLDCPKSVLNFFVDTFPDAVPLLGATQLSCDFVGLRPRPLVYVSCDPFHVGDRALLIGDAAHAMVPFYGQGMNAGFEDCYVLDQILNSNRDDVAASVKQFTAERKDDVHVISQLALYNYTEMRDLVTTPSYHIRKKLDDFLYGLLPNVWMPLYTTVTFTDLTYRQCVENRRWQDKVLCVIKLIIVVGTIIILLNQTIKRGYFDNGPKTFHLQEL